MYSIFVDSLTQVDMSYLKIPMAVIYDSPKDFPELCLCRLWEGAGCRPTTTAIYRNTIDKLREDIRAAGFHTVIPRSKEDDPVIVETWIK